MGHENRWKWRHFQGPGFPRTLITPVWRRVLSLSLAVCLVLGMTLALPVTAYALPAQGSRVGEPSHGVDLEALRDGGVYYGVFEHVFDVDYDVMWGKYTVKDAGWEEAPSPILWRGVGEEDNNIVLWSQYVLDFNRFVPNYGDPNAYRWDVSIMREWLHGEFAQGFHSGELDGIAVVDVTSGSGEVLNTAYSQRFYLPWATGTGASEMEFGAGNTSGLALPVTGTDLGGRLKSDLYTDFVEYQLRSPVPSDKSASHRYDLSHRISARQTDAIIGVRPVFQLHPENILFATRVVDDGSGDGMGTMNETQFYSAEPVAGSNGANYKLAVVGQNNGANVGTLSGVPSGSISLQTGQPLWLGNLQADWSGSGDYTVNYKIVDTGGTHTIRGYGFTPAGAATDLAITTSGLGDGTYTVYVWLQRNNEINSHEGTLPGYFTLDLSSSGPTYGLALGASGALDFGSRVEGYAPVNGQAVQVTATGSTTNLSVRLDGLDKDSFTVSGIDSSGRFTVAPKTGLRAGGYSATVTVTGDYAPPQSVAATFAVAADTSRPSVSGGPLNMKPGESRSFAVSLGKGADAADSATITSSDDGIATATPTQLDQSGSVTVTGVAKGATTISIGYSGGPRDGETDTVRVAVTSGGSSSSSSGSSSGGSNTPDWSAAKTQLPASAFSWDGRTLIIDHAEVTPLGLLSVKWDDVETAAYSVYSGSVLLRFDEDFLAAQSPGEHTVRVEFLTSTGTAVVAVGEIRADVPANSSGDYTNVNDNPSTGGEPDSRPGAAGTPNTKDGRFLWTALLLGGVSLTTCRCKAKV